jgi:hypothetical protein
LVSGVSVLNTSDFCKFTLPEHDRFTGVRQSVVVSVLKNHPTHSPVASNFTSGSGMRLAHDNARIAFDRLAAGQRQASNQRIGRQSQPQ